MVEEMFKEGDLVSWESNYFDVMRREESPVYVVVLEVGHMLVLHDIRTGQGVVLGKDNPSHNVGCLYKLPNFNEVLKGYMEQQNKVN